LSQDPHALDILANAPDTIGDDFPSYVDDHFGYQYDVWGYLTRAERAEHDLLRNASPASFDEDTTRRSDLELLAMAHAWLSAGDAANAAKLLDQIIARDKHHQGVAFDEVCEYAVLLWLRADESARAKASLGLAATKLASWSRHDLLAGVLQAREGEAVASQELMQRYIDAEPTDSPERAYEAAELLARHGFARAARAFIAQSRALSVNTTGALLVDLDLLEAELPEDDRVRGVEEE